MTIQYNLLLFLVFRWMQHPRRRWQLWLWIRCWVLLRCNPGPLEKELQNVLICNKRTCSDYKWKLCSPSRQAEHHRSQVGEFSNFILLTFSLLIFSFTMIASFYDNSMGGHGALICALKNPGKYQSVSAFAPICNPTRCKWGQKAFSGYLGTDEKNFWSDWDAVELVDKYNGPPLEILIDQVGYHNLNCNILILTAITN